MTGLGEFHLRPAGRTFGQAFDEQVGRLESRAARAQPNDQGRVPAPAGGIGRHQPDPAALRLCGTRALAAAISAAWGAGVAAPAGRLSSNFAEYGTQILAQAA